MKDNTLNTMVHNISGFFLSSVACIASGYPTLTKGSTASIHHLLFFSLC